MKQKIISVGTFIGGVLAAQAATWYVSTNGNDGANNGTGGWDQAYATISNAVFQAQTNSGNVVLVSNGMYQSGGFVADNGTNMVTITNGITVRGFSGNPADVIVDGGGSNRCFRVNHNQAMIADLTIRNGYVYGPTYGGGGMMLYAGLVTNCAIVSNQAGTTGSGYDGGGMYVYPPAVSSTCRVEGCTIAFNKALKYEGGGMTIMGTAAGQNKIMVVNCVITNNEAKRNGGGVYCVGGGVYAGNGGTLSNCVIAGNLATNTGGTGGGVWISGMSILRNCLVCQNRASAGNGGGGYLAAGVPQLVSCTIVSNVSYGIKCNTSVALTGMVVNCVVYSNLNSDAISNYLVMATNCYFTNCCTLPLPATGSGNLTNAPQFKDFAGGNYRLAAGSLCINAGTNETWMDTAADLAGGPRIRYGQVDIGCYEFFLNLKVNGVPINRMIKSINGVPISRIKSINGVPVH